MIEVGQSFEIEYPFVRTTVDIFDGEKVNPHKSWRPGTEYETRGGGYHEEPEMVCIANGVGKKISTVVEVVKLPKPFPPRVFFTVKWRSPDGVEFGKNKLRIATRECFLRKATRFAYEYELTK